MFGSILWGNGKFKFDSVNSPRNLENIYFCEIVNKQKLTSYFVGGTVASRTTWMTSESYWVASFLYCFPILAGDSDGIVIEYNAVSPNWTYASRLTLFECYLPRYSQQSVSTIVFGLASLSQLASVPPGGGTEPKALIQGQSFPVLGGWVLLSYVTLQCSASLNLTLH